MLVGSDAAERERVKLSRHGRKEVAWGLNFKLMPDFDRLGPCRREIEWSDVPGWQGVIEEIVSTGFMAVVNVLVAVPGPNWPELPRNDNPAWLGQWQHCNETIWMHEPEGFYSHLLLYLALSELGDLAGNRNGRDFSSTWKLKSFALIINDFFLSLDDDDDPSEVERWVM